MRDFLAQATKLLKRQKQYRRQMMVFLCLAVVVAFGTVTALKLYGQAMTHKKEVLACDYKVHVHTDECYERDGEGNLGNEPVCGYADYVVHVHNDDCYDENHNLVCTLEEHKPHKHTEECYVTEKVLVCGLEEDVPETDGAPAGTEPAEAEEPVPEPTPEPTAQPEAASVIPEVQEEVLICQAELHAHDESCYEKKLSCGHEEHVHGEGCTSQELSCVQEEHAHGEGCYDEEGNLTCELPEHTHGEGCYETVITCELEEHTHDDSCYTEELICGKEEHQHGEGCYELVTVPGTAEPVEETVAAPETAAADNAASQEPAEPESSASAEEVVQGHVHTEECYEEVRTLICGELELHTHDNSCYTGDCFDGEGNLIPGSRPSCGLLQLEEHIHAGDCIKTVELTPEEVAALNNGATLHIHTDECYDEEKNLICGHEVTHIHGLECYDEAGNQICSHGQEAESQYICGKEEHTHSEECYDEEENLICGKEEHAHDETCLEEEEAYICGKEEHTHSEECYDQEGNLNCGKEEHIHDETCLEEEEAYICGKEEHTHSEECYDGEENLTCGKEEHTHDETCLEEKAEPENEKTCEGSGYSVKVTYPDSAEIPEEAELIVRQITEESDPERFAQRQAEAREALENENINVHALFDIGFYVDGQEIEPKDTVNVTIQLLDENGLPEGTPMQIVHFAESGSEVLESGDIDSEGNASFETDSFSEFMLVGAIGKFAIITGEGLENNGADGNLTCGKEEHTHDEECYDANGELTCEKEEHTHDETCLAKKTYICGKEEHTHGEGCYGADGNLTCEKEEHTHDETCLVESLYTCGQEEHTHSEECNDEEGNQACEKGEHTHELACLVEKAKNEVENVNRLIAALPSEDAITEEMAKYEEAGEEAYEKYKKDLIEQIQEACDAYLELNKVLRQYVTGMENLQTLAKMMGVFFLDEETGNSTVVPDYAAFLPIGDQPGDGTKNGIVLELLYGDMKSHADKLHREVGTDEEGKKIYIDGEDPNYTRDKMKGNFKLYTSNIQGNTQIGDITLSLYFPEEYVDFNEIDITNFFQEGLDYDKIKTEETRNGKKYYKISIMLKDYIPTSALTLSFDMKFKTAEVPKDYELKIFGTLERMVGDEKEESKPTAENIYRPKYEKPRITKYVNTNLYENMSEDHTRVAATVKDGVVEGSEYVSFWYKVGDNHQLLRAYDTITLRDKLPEYKNINGETKYAVFDPSVNLGWKLDETDPSGHTVKRVFNVTELQGAEIWNPDQYDNKLMLQIEQAELKLQFPGCKIEENAGDGFLIADLENHVTAECEPYKTPEESSPLHEENDTCEDGIIFTLTNQPGAKGSFTKGNSADTIMDTYVTRSGAYRWNLAFKNISSSKLVNVEMGDDVIDNRLKFQSIVIEGAAKQDDNCNFINILENLEYVEAFTYESDGGTGDAVTEEISGETAEDDETPIKPEEKPGDKYYPDKFTSTGKLVFKGNGSKTLDTSYTLTLNPEKEYRKFIIHFKDGFEVAIGEGIRVWAFSTFRDPESGHFVEGQLDSDPNSKNIYKNHAYTAYQQKGFEGPYYKTYFLKCPNKFKLIKNTESIWLEKRMLFGDNKECPPKEGWVHDLKYYTFAQLYIEGSLSADKKYEDLCLIDLLPDSLEVYPDNDGSLNLADGSGKIYIQRYEIIPNFHNSGRTALIIYLNADEVKKCLDFSDGEGSARVYISPRLRVKPNAVPGNYTNDAYLVSKDFNEPPTGKGQQPDILNIQDKNTETYTAQIRWASAGGSIQGAGGIFARKYIAKEGSNTWTTNALRLSVGENFQYKLSMMNFEKSGHKNLVVYDVLPRIGDKSINGQADRESEFSVNLIGPIPEKDSNGNRLYPEGYQVYYTTSQDVYSNDMASLIGKESIWTQKVEDWEQADWINVTAFKFVAEEETVFGDKQLDFIIPVKVMDVLTEESEAKLNNKTAEDRETGTAIYLEAINSFGYSTASYPGINVESNYVKAQISFAGFVVKKTDEKGNALPGAIFKLEKQKATGLTPSTDGTEEGTQTQGDGNQTANSIPQTSGDTNNTAEWEMIQDNVKSDENGILSFKNLAVGTYRLTEKEAPTGYKISTEPITITITLDKDTMEYKVTADVTGSGTGSNPFVVVNETFYQLPETGGIGSKLYTMAGAAFLALGAGFLYKKKFRERRV